MAASGVMMMLNRNSVAPLHQADALLHPLDHRPVYGSKLIKQRSGQELTVSEGLCVRLQ